jgi:hypothetical protein
MRHKWPFRASSEETSQADCQASAACEEAGQSDVPFAECFAEILHLTHSLSGIDSTLIGQARSRRESSERVFCLQFSRGFCRSGHLGSQAGCSGRQHKDCERAFGRRSFAFKLGRGASACGIRCQSEVIDETDYENHVVGGNLEDRSGDRRSWSFGWSCLRPNHKQSDAPACEGCRNPTVAG